MLFTIGYAAFQVESFLGVLKRYGINVVIDVRSVPYSKRHDQYNKEAIESLLRKNGIYYRNYSAEFGARQTDPGCLSPDGVLDFELFAKSPIFQSGVGKVNASLAKGYCLALMCAEKDPAVCHRSILVSRAFHQAGVPVGHILEDGCAIGQDAVESRLLDAYFPNRDQLSLLEDNSIDQLISMAYRRRNREIGYRAGE